MVPNNGELGTSYFIFAEQYGVYMEMGVEEIYYSLAIKYADENLEAYVASNKRPFVRYEKGAAIFAGVPGEQIGDEYCVAVLPCIAANLIDCVAQYAEHDAAIAVREQAVEREISRLRRIAAAEDHVVDIDGVKYYLQGRTLSLPAAALSRVIGRDGRNIKRLSSVLGFAIQLGELYGDTNECRKIKYNLYY